MTKKDKMYLADISKDRNNNLDIMRFMAALMVIFSHALPISRGAAYADILSEWTDGRLSFGALAVGIFFVSGGFLIAKSAERKNNYADYFKARCIRIFPQLIFVTVVLALFAGPILSVLSPGEYYSSPGTWRYLLNGIFVLQHNLPGVFTENIYGATVNGPLWTLPVEFLCYIMCFMALKLGILSKKGFRFTILPAIIVGIISTCFASTFLITVIRPVMLFYIGMGMYVYRDKILMDDRLGILSCVLFAGCVLIKADMAAMYLFFPYMIYYLAFGLKYKCSNFGRRGEFSYGMYLWGWPAGQIVCMAAGGEMNWMLNAVLASVIAILLGVVNYYVVDCNINRLQKKISTGKQS